MQEGSWGTGVGVEEAGARGRGRIFTLRLSAKQNLPWQDNRRTKVVRCDRDYVTALHLSPGLANQSKVAGLFVMCLHSLLQANSGRWLSSTLFPSSPVHAHSWAATVIICTLCGLLVWIYLWNCVFPVQIANQCLVYWSSTPPPVMWTSMSSRCDHLHTLWSEFTFVFRVLFTNQYSVYRAPPPPPIPPSPLM